MDIQENNQLELFSGPDSLSIKQARNDSPFMANIRRHEKMILIIIAVIITGIVSFSLGVEKGKKMPLPEPKVEQPLPVAVAQTATLKQEAIPVEEQKNQAIIGSFTIQVASFKSKTSAQREADVLKNKGFNPIVLTKGSYNVLCVGNFPSKKEAQTTLSQLKKRYTGCYIRRL